jgi:CRP/FNR family transcriptional regulator, dissimilatory nitrate respiration regulator
LHSETTTTTDDLIKRHYLFADLDDAQLGVLKQGMRRIRLEDGEILFQRGQPARRFFLVVSGVIALQRVSSRGDEKVINVMRAGNSFAEALMFHKSPAYPVTAMSIGETALLAFDNDKFMRLLAGSVDTCFRVMGHMSIRLHRFVNQVDSLTLQNAACRVTSYLLGHLPADASSNAEVQLDVPKHIIASHLSIKPETLSRVLNCLSQQDLVSVEGRIIRIPDVGKLRDSLEHDID